MAKPKTLFDKFNDQHLPKVPDFVETNSPKFDPGYTLGPSVRPAHEQHFIDIYFNGDLRHLQADISARPTHYTAEQKEIIETMTKKLPLPPNVLNQHINEIVLRFMEKSEHREKREKIIQKAQKSTEDDPTVERALQEATFEDQGSMPKSIKII